MIALCHYEIGQLILKSLWNISKGSSKTTVEISTYLQSTFIVTFQYLLKTSENLKVFLCVHGVQKFNTG